MSRGATVRLFVAVDPPLEVREALSGWARAVAPGVETSAGRGFRLRVLDVEAVHITLCFLGARPVGELDGLAAALPPCAGHACELTLGAPLWLPPRRPQAMSVEVHDEDGELGRLQADVSAALAAVSAWQPERRRFRPHVTVARVRGSGGAGRHGRDRGALLPAPVAAATPSLSFMAESLALYRSWLEPSGARYEAIARCSLLPA
jgi:2'-5' RNA ligase